MSSKRGAKAPYGRAPRCPSCDSQQVRATGRPTRHYGAPTVRAHCDGCGEDWDSTATALVRAYDMQIAKVGT